MLLRSNNEYKAEHHARYKLIDMSPRLLPVVLEDQLVPGGFVHAAHLVDSSISRGLLPAIATTNLAPSILLKEALLAYSQGIISDPPKFAQKLKRLNSKRQAMRLKTHAHASRHFF
jgi:hypothetical protein